MAEEKRCWLYTRIDAPEDTHGNLKAQEKVLLDFASKQGYEVAGTASDLGFERSLRRPGIARVIDAAKDNQFQILLSQNIRAISDNTAEAIGFLSYLYDIGIDTHTTEDGFIDVHEKFRELHSMISHIPESIAEPAQDTSMK